MTPKLEELIACPWIYNHQLAPTTRTLQGCAHKSKFAIMKILQSSSLSWTMSKYRRTLKRRDAAEQHLRQNPRTFRRCGFAWAVLAKSTSQSEDDTMTGVYAPFQTPTLLLAEKLFLVPQDSLQDRYRASLPDENVQFFPRHNEEQLPDQPCHSLTLVVDAPFGVT